jgi:hypothetical protein
MVLLGKVWGLVRTKWLAREGRLPDESCGIVGNVITDVALCTSIAYRLQPRFVFPFLLVFSLHTHSLFMFICKSVVLYVLEYLYAGLEMVIHADCLAPEPLSLTVLFPIL